MSSENPMINPFDFIGDLGVLPVIAIERVSDALPLADALLEGGLPVAEITFRTPAAADVIDVIARERKELLIGAGTIVDTRSLDAAIRSGAHFGLSPGFDDVIVDAAARMKFAFAPGVMTPSDLIRATGRDVQLAKFFPAGPAGGPAMLRAIAAPFAHLGMKFCPTGGVSPDTLGDWLILPEVAAVGGTWIASAGDIREGRFADIQLRARKAVQLARRHLELRR
jgi:2-dehydro-3-deoxyphosphogluconate aldolase/(4S)-4-hydroxy-2-oxoglutarate aldolase